MARPKKDKAERRTGQIVVYVQEPIKQALQAEADSSGMTVSALAAEILEDHISSANNNDQRIVVHPDVIYAVIRQMAYEGLLSGTVLDGKFAPKTNVPEKFVQKEDMAENGYPQQAVYNSVDMVVDKNSANSAPSIDSNDKFAPRMPEVQKTSRTSATKRTAPTTRRRKIVRRTMPEGGGDGDT